MRTGTLWILWPSVYRSQSDSAAPVVSVASTELTISSGKWRESWSWNQLRREEPVGTSQHVSTWSCVLCSASAAWPSVITHRCLSDWRSVTKLSETWPACQSGPGYKTGVKLSCLHKDYGKSISELAGRCLQTKKGIAARRTMWKICGYHKPGHELHWAVLVGLCVDCKWKRADEIILSPKARALLPFHQEITPLLWEWKRLYGETTSFMAYLFYWYLTSNAWA